MNKAFKFNFGLLNIAQDATNIADSEAQEARSVDLDALALGTLQPGTYLTPAPQAKSWLTATMGGRAFRLHDAGGGVLMPQFEQKSGTWDWLNGGGAPWTPTAPPDLGLASGESITYDTPNIPGIVFKVATGQSYSGPTREAYTLYIDSATPPNPPFVPNWTVTYRRQKGSGGYLAPAPVIPGAEQVMFDNIVVVFPSFASSPGAGDGWSPASGNSASATVVKNSVGDDGIYTYRIVHVRNADVTPTQNIESLPGPKGQIEIKNYDEFGAQIAYNAPQVSFIVTLPGGVNEAWMFRKDPEQKEYIRVARYDGTKIYRDDGSDDITGATFTDNSDFSSFDKLVTLKSGDDENFTTINSAIGNSGGFSRLFEKDNRLWLVPKGRAGILLYSRIGDWWGWTRTNSFATTSPITDIVFVRDPTVVGGQVVTVIGTGESFSSGKFGDLYHLYGIGVEDDPYRLVKAVEGINVFENSMVNMNGVIAFLSYAWQGGALHHDFGPYGTKAYLYNLQRAAEISTRVKFSNNFAIPSQVEYAVMLGGDKYLVKKIGVDTPLIYHMAGKGWIETTAALETAASFTWLSKEFAPASMQDFKIAYARMLKVDFQGQITLTFYIEDDNGAVETKAFPFSSTTRKEIIQRLPHIRGRKWSFKVQGTNTINALARLYGLFFVQ